MAKKYTLLQFAPGTKNNNKPKTYNLFGLSSIGLDEDQNVIKSSLSLGYTQTQESWSSPTGSINDYSEDFWNSPFAQYRDITKNNSEFVAFFDNTYEVRRTYLRQFAQNGEIQFVLDTICDEAIVVDENNYFAQVDLDKLKANLNVKYEKTEDLLKCCETSFNRIYSMYGWDVSNSAWDYFRKFLIDGFLAFEIIFEYDNQGQAKNIIAFKEVDPITLEPDIVMDQTTGEKVKIWYQYKNDPEKQRIIPDANLIYISWAKGNFAEGSRASYLEGLTRSFNMLRQLENSRIMWNIQNAQKRIKIVAPIGTMAPDRAKARLSQLKAMYNEDTSIDERSGEVTVNGQPKFSFTKTYIFPSAEGSQTEISEMGVDGYDMNSTEQLKYFWRRFILETKIPPNRFLADPSQTGTSLTDDSNITREEYAFSRFISRLQATFKEVLLKPLWVQICLKMPELKDAPLFRTYLGIKYNFENVFTMAKERKAMQDASGIIGTMAGMQYRNQKPVFSMQFLLKKFMNISDEDWALNNKYLQGEELAEKQQQTQQQGQGGAENEGFGPDLGGGMDVGGGGFDTGGGDLGGDMGGGLGDDMGAPAPDMGGGDMGGGLGGGDLGAPPEPEGTLI